jgi:hypothetical protein
MSLEISNSPNFVPSAFPLQKRKPIESMDKGDFSIPMGFSIPDYIRAVYGQNKVESFHSMFNFLDRDNKERRYDPATEDPFVAKDEKFIPEFKASAHRMLAYLTQEWKDRGYETEMDKDRQIELPSDAAFVKKILSVDSASWNKDAARWKADREDLAYIIAEADIMKKACLVRTVLPGWWVVSYRGKNALRKDRFKKAMNILVRAMHDIMETQVYKDKLEETLADQGDPLDTNVGYPFYSALVDTDGNPISKLEVLDLYKGIGTQGWSWNAVRREIDRRCPNKSLKGYPFAIFSIRRQQPGYKWAHNFTPTTNGLRFSQDVRGYTTNRVAYGASYVLNLYLSSVQSSWKTIRKLIPGLYHDGDAKKRDIEYLGNENPFMIESDYSNWDRNIPVDLSQDFFKAFCAKIPHGNYYYDLLCQTNSNLSMIWPDWVGDEKGRGHIFNVDKLALLSGLKITSDIGTYMNAIIIITSLLESGVMGETDVYNHLMSRVKGKEGDMLFLVQSDDTLLVRKELKSLAKLAAKFSEVSSDSGIKGSLTLGDRFLMRHMYKGKDSPLAARNFQNTLSNEQSYQDPVKFTVGLGARTDGLFGYKSVDAFGGGKFLETTSLERDFSLKVLEELYGFLNTAHIKVPAAIHILELLIRSGQKAVKRGSKYTVNEIDGRALDAERVKWNMFLAKRDLELLQRKGKGAFASHIYELYKDSMSPTRKAILDQILAASPEARSVLQTVSQKETVFYNFALAKLKITKTYQQPNPTY